MSEISVIVPVYKVEPYLRRCVDSILAQTFSDIEVILVDDGSPDACPAICDEYARLDKRIKVIHQEHQGVSAARNAGLDWVFANSDSQWISFVDSDDWVHPQFLEYLHRAAVESKVKISICNVREVSSFTTADDILPSGIYTVEDAMAFYSENYFLGTVAWNKIYSREVFLQARYPVGKLHEDAFLTYRLLYQAYRIAYIDSSLYYYYRNENSIMHSSYSLSRISEVEALEEQYHFFIAHSLEKNILPSRERLIGRYAEHISSLQSMNNKDALEIAYKMRKKLRILLRQSGRQIRQSENSMWYFEAAYPKLADYYWKAKRLEFLVHTEGIVHTIGRINRRRKKSNK